MASEKNPDLSRKETDFNDEMQEIAFDKRGCCCFWIPSTTLWERISTAEKEETNWWAKSVNALKKVREWSELVAGPKWKTFIRQFNKHRAKQGKFQYDPLSYSLNFDEGPGQNGHLEDDRVFRDFSSRYASIPISAKSSMDLGKDGPSFT
ncbi:unnamed protein product [Ilex paraguariensis]|uniref:Uncharacterized protein n=1 Tax=Ilex paraguariensis TaxID=185542 RepID=A0ABC8T5V4_9AQUA